MALLHIDLDGMVHLLNSLLSVLVGLYSTAQRLFAFHVELPSKDLPPMIELTVDAFGVRRSMRTFPMADHVSHLEGVTPSA